MRGAAASAMVVDAGRRRARDLVTVEETSAALTAVEAKPLGPLAWLNAEEVLEHLVVDLEGHFAGHRRYARPAR